MNMIIAFIGGLVTGIFGYRLIFQRAAAFTMWEADKIAKKIEAIKETSATQYTRLRAEWEYIMSTGGKDLRKASVDLMQIIQQIKSI